VIEHAYTNFGDGITKARLQELWTFNLHKPKINILFWHTKVAQSAHDNHLNLDWKSLGRSLTNEKCYHNICHTKIQANSKLTTIAGGIHKAREMMEM